MFTLPAITSQVEDTSSDPSSRISVLGTPPVATITTLGFSEKTFSLLARQL